MSTINPAATSQTDAAEILLTPEDTALNGRAYAEPETEADAEVEEDAPRGVSSEDFEAKKAAAKLERRKNKLLACIARKRTLNPAQRAEAIALGIPLPKGN